MIATVTPQEVFLQLSDHFFRGHFTRADKEHFYQLKEKMLHSLGFVPVAVCPRDGLETLMGESLKQGCVNLGALSPAVMQLSPHFSDAEAAFQKLQDDYKQEKKVFAAAAADLRARFREVNDVLLKIVQESEGNDQKAAHNALANFTALTDNQIESIRRLFERVGVKDFDIPPLPFPPGVPAEMQDIFEEGLRVARQKAKQVFEQTIEGFLTTKEEVFEGLKDLHLDFTPIGMHPFHNKEGTKQPDRAPHSLQPRGTWLVAFMAHDNKRWIVYKPYSRQYDHLPRRSGYRFRKEAELPLRECLGILGITPDSFPDKLVPPGN